MKRRDKPEVIVETLINKMFEIAKHEVTYNDIKERQDNWYQQWTMTEEQNKEWVEWGKSYLKKQKFLLPDREMAFFNLNYGLKTVFNETTEN
jgi:hypothetical protein